MNKRHLSSSLYSQYGAEIMIWLTSNKNAQSKRVSTARFIFGITKKGERAAGRLIPSKPKRCLKFPKRK
jgi:hypothetical protein